MQKRKSSKVLEIKVSSKKVCCNGHNSNDEDHSSHPVIYLDVEEDEPTRCPYCNQVFIYDCTIEQIDALE